MKRWLVISLFWGNLAFAQMGIGTELPHASAELHIASKDGNKGVLIPEIALKTLVDKSVVFGGQPQNGLVVYNITDDATQSLSPGFYYWDVIKYDATNLPIYGWNRIIGSADLQKSITDNTKDISFENINKDGNTIKTDGFRLLVNGNEIGAFNETLTKFSIETSKYYVLVKDGSSTGGANDPYEIFVKLDAGDSEDNVPGNKLVAGYIFSDKVITKEEFVYRDEAGKTDVYELKNVIENAETLTMLRLETNYLIDNNGVEQRVPALVYKDEIGVETPILLNRLFEFSETLTNLELNTTDMTLVYTDEKKATNEINIDAITKSAWNKAGEVNKKGVFGDNVYTNGWVGIGYDSPSGTVNEKLRVNGSVTAVNSYYADYVFDAYFKGASPMKYDYKFKDLKAIESYVKTNNHLPGITPISKLEVTDLGYSFNLSELSIQLLEKTEELYLHTIEQEKKIEVLKDENTRLLKRVEAIESMLEKNSHKQIK